MQSFEPSFIFTSAGSSTGIGCSGFRLEDVGDNLVGNGFNVSTAQEPESLLAG